MTGGSVESSLGPIPVNLTVLTAAPILLRRGQRAVERQPLCRACRSKLFTRLLKRPNSSGSVSVACTVVLLSPCRPFLCNEYECNLGVEAEDYKCPPLLLHFRLSGILA